MLNFLTFEEYKAHAERHFETGEDGKKVGYWKNYTERWKYHQRAIDIIGASATTDPSKVLELGTMGMQIVKNSHMMDYEVNLDLYEYAKPTHIHDARSIPWPIETNAYEWFVALRVYHHLSPVQREAFEESCRVSENVLLVVPNAFGKNSRAQQAAQDAALKPADFRSWNQDRPAGRVEPVGKFGFLYVWTKHDMASRR